MTLSYESGRADEEIQWMIFNADDGSGNGTMTNASTMKMRYCRKGIGAKSNMSYAESLVAEVIEKR